MTQEFLSNRSGASAVEFAIIMPMFLVLLFGMIAYGTYFGVVHGIQQLTAEAARASIAGVNDNERMSIALANINANVSSYAILTPAHLTIQSASTDPTTNAFSVTVKYDASDMFIFNLPNIIPVPNPIIVRSAVIQRGGY